MKERKEGAYMAHIYYGDPSEEFSMNQIKTLVESGADFIEFGIPFSDPTADGPTFQGACERALRNGITPAKCIRGIKKLREDGLETPIIVTTYFNIPFVAGIEDFLNEIKEAGAQAVIVPDLPFEEASVFLAAGKKTGLHVVFQVAPTTTEERLKKIVKKTSGFLYIINVEGVTGAREKIAGSALELISRVRQSTNTPIIAGFGVSKKEHAAAIISAGADGVVTGSALGKIYEKNLERPEQTLPEIARFARLIKRGCIEGYRQRSF